MFEYVCQNFCSLFCFLIVWQIQVDIIWRFSELIGYNATSSLSFLIKQIFQYFLIYRRQSCTIVHFFEAQYFYHLHISKNFLSFKVFNQLLALKDSNKLLDAFPVFEIFFQSNNLLFHSNDLRFNFLTRFKQNWEWKASWANLFNFLLDFFCGKSIFFSVRIYIFNAI